MRRLAIALCLLAAIPVLAGVGRWYQQIAAMQRQPSAAASGPTEPGTLKLWWHAKEGDTGAFLQDDSGNGNYGTQATAGAQCIVENGYYIFNGAQWAATTSSSIGNGATQLLCSAWVYPTQWVDYAGIISASEPCVQYHSDLEGLVFRTNENIGVYHDDTYVDSVYPIPTGTWTHVVVFFDVGYAVRANRKAGIWTNGVFTQWTTGIGQTTNMVVDDPWYIAFDKTYAERKAKSRIDDVRIYVNPANGPLAATNIWLEGRQ